MCKISEFIAEVFKDNLYMDTRIIYLLRKSK